MMKKILAIGIVCLFFFGGIVFINSSEVKGESITVLSATLPTGRSYTSAIWDGEHPYIFGGHSVGTEYDQILRYNTSSDAITIMSAKLPTGRDGTSAIWNGTHAFIFGGGNGASGNPSVPTGTRYNEILRYNPKTDSITTMSATLPKEIFFTCAVWDGENAYIFGGQYDAGDGTYNTSDEIVRYDPSTDTVTLMSAKLPEKRSGGSGFYDGNYIYIFPGSPSPNQILRYDPILDNITTMSANLPTSSYGEKLSLTSAIWDGKYAYIFGGINENTRFFSEIFQFIPSIDNVSEMSVTLPSARHGTSAIWDGENAYIFGGYTGSGYLNQIVQYELPDTIAPPSPFNVSAIPGSWTNSNSFTINWTNPIDESGLKSGAWYKIGRPPINDSDGIWQDGKPITVSSIEGNQTIYLWLEDTHGNKDFKNNASTQIYLDTTPPEPFTPTANPNGWTSNNQPQITFSTMDLLSGMDHYEVRFYSGIFPIQNSPYTLPSLSDGTHNIIVRAYDIVGNYRDANLVVQIDTTPPSPPTDVSATPDNWTNSNSFIINWTNPIETDTSGIKSGVWYKIGSHPTSNSDGTWEAGKSITISSLEGEQTIYIWLEDNLGNTNYLNYSSVILYLDTIPPSISHTPPASGVVDEPITIHAIITDNVAVKSATLYYRKNGDTNWSSVSMTQDGDSYSAEIPVSVVTMAGVQYYISASDEVNTASYPSLAPTNNYFNLTIRDVSPPTISHTPVSNRTAGQAITISATITDNVGVTGATLYYKIKGTSTWSSIPMTQNVNVFSADIPASDVTTDGVEYYIFATDDIFNTTSPGVNPQTAPYEITVTKEPKIDDKDVLFVPSWLWLLLVLFIILVLIVLFLSLRRRGEEMEVGPIAEEGPIVEEVGEIIPEEEPQPELPEETELPKEESKLKEEVEELEAPETPKEEKIPSLPSQDISDDEIFENIKKKYEEGKLSKETFEDFKKRYGKE